MNRTVTALLGRGVDLQKARDLASGGYTIGSLKELSKAELEALRLPLSAVKSLERDRPPIPTNTLHRLLQSNARCCCICRDPSKSIIVHHISPWEKSKDHSIQNLAILCLQDHDEAHTKRTLSRTLSEVEVRAAKKAWEMEIAALAGRAIANASLTPETDWLYFNHRRLFDLADQKGIDARRWIREQGFEEFSREARTLSYMYDSGSGFGMGIAMSEFLRDLLEKVVVINISDELDRGSLKSIVPEGTIVFVQGAHYFSSRDGKKQSGSGQTTEVRRGANGVEVRFQIDRWEATSNSAKYSWLKGRQSVGSLLRVRDRRLTDNKLIVSCSALAIAHGLDALKSRDYAQGAAEFIYRRQDWSEEYDNESFSDEDDFAKL